MKNLLKHPIVIGAIAFFVIVIATISILLSGSKETLILQPGAGQIIENTNSEVGNILDEPEMAEETDDMILENITSGNGQGGGDTGEAIIEGEYSIGSIVVNNFGPRTSITSPLTLTGKAPRSWFFEGSFPVMLMTLEGDIISEAPGNGDWLSPVGDSEEIGANDMIEFNVNMNFDIPVDSTGEAKLRFSKDNTSALPENSEYVEELVILSE